MIPNASEFNKMKNPIVKTAVGAILIKDNKIFLTKRAQNLIEGGKWCLPGGHIDIGETAIEAVKREIKEETGLDLSKPVFYNYFDEYFPHIKQHSIVLIFTGEPKGQENMNEEVSEQKWVSQNELQNFNLAFKHERIITEFFKSKESP